MIVVIVKNNYVVNRIVVDDDYQCKDGEFVDSDLNIFIGDWYEASEGRFMRYVDAHLVGWPSDAPEELQK